MFYIINKTDNQIEAIYEIKENADLICRNFSEINPNKAYVVMEECKCIQDRPTPAQLYRIRQIEWSLNIPFTKITKKSASNFLERHIAKTKPIDEAYNKLKMGIID